MPKIPPDEGAPHGLSSLRRAGRVTEVLFLNEIALHPHTRLRPIARSLGVTVQAVSQLHRALSRRGWVQLVDGVYRPTVRGTAALHEALTSVRTDVDDRLGRLRVVGRTRAIARRSVRAGEQVLLSMEEGVLSARPGARGASRGRAVHPARSGDLVEVEALEGILPMRPAPVRCLVLPTRPSSGAALAADLRAHLRTRAYAVLAAEGLEAFHLMRRCTSAAVARFGVAAVCREASQMGVSVLVVVTEERLPAFLQRLSEPTPVAPVDLETLGERSTATR